MKKNPKKIDYRLGSGKLFKIKNFIIIIPIKIMILWNLMQPKHNLKKNI